MGAFSFKKYLQFVPTNDIMYVQGGDNMANLTKRVAFRCTEEEFEMIKDQAECNNQTMTDYIKFLILEDSEPIEGDDFNTKGGD